MLKPYQMKTLDQLVLNEANPRSISDKKFQQLIDSLLIFPKMLELRPIVARADGTILGGNMRFKALQAITDLTIYQLESRLMEIRKYNELSQDEKQALIDYWDNFLSTRQVPVTTADHLSDAQVQEFIIKDNVGYGAWDLDQLGELWDKDDLDDWGLDIMWPGTDGSQDDESSGSGDKEKKLIVQASDIGALESLFHELKDRGFTVEFK